jgi:hypothetical protein
MSNLQGCFTELQMQATPPDVIFRPVNNHNLLKHPQGKHPQGKHPQGKHPQGKHPQRNIKPSRTAAQLLWLHSTQQSSAAFEANHSNQAAAH